MLVDSKVKGKKENTMNRIVKMATIVAGIGAVLGFAGCGLEDSLLQTEVEKMVREHVQGKEEIVKLYDVDKCVNFTISPEDKGIRRGTVDLGLKSKKTGKIETLGYQFKYNTESDEVEVGVKDPMQAVKLVGLKNLLN